MCGMLVFCARKKAKNGNTLNVFVEDVAHVHDALVQGGNTLNVSVEDVVHVHVHDALVQVVNTLNVSLDEVELEMLKSSEDALVQVVDILNVSLDEVELEILKSSEDAWEQDVHASQEKVGPESLECSEVMCIQHTSHDASTCTADDWNNDIQDRFSYIN
jgi:prephenate dehydratase